MTRARRRQLGITVFQMLPVVRELKAAGEISKGQDPRDRALVVIGEIMGSKEYSAAWKKVGEPDWDAIMEIVMMILDFLMKFL